MPHGESTTTEFIYEGDLLVGQKTSDGKGDMTFLHDDTGAYIGLIYEGVEYYYMKNVQGDIIGIVDAEGVIQAVYTYEPFGKLFSIETKSGFLRYDGDWSVGGMNPIRYRGYYYDYDTKLYYLNSRYYDPYVGRFISSDTTDILTSTPMEVTNKNLYAYCDNNSIVRADTDGQFWNFVVGAAIGAVSVYVGDVIENIAEGKSGLDILKPTSSVGTYLGAAVSGMLPGGGLASMIARPIISTGIKYSVDCIIRKKEFKPEEAAFDLALNAGGELLSLGVNHGLNRARPQNYSTFRHQMTRRIPHITQQQTKQVMYALHRSINVLIEIAQFAISAATNR